MTPLAHQIADIERQISIIERTAANYIGGDKAYYSGRQTFLKPAAQRKVDLLNKKLDVLLDIVEA
jgi:antirestriction protein ArdC